MEDTIAYIRKEIETPLVIVRQLLESFGTFQKFMFNSSRIFSSIIHLCQLVRKLALLKSLDRFR